MSNKIGLLTGSFDPVTKGHMDLIIRASRIFDQLYVGIFYNQEKPGFFPIERRKAMLEAALAEYNSLGKVTVMTSHSQLTVDVAREVGARTLVRGLRNGMDLTYETSMDYFNHDLAPEIETIYLASQPSLTQISSTRIRELIHFGADISAYVPKSVVLEIEKGKN